MRRNPSPFLESRAHNLSTVGVLNIVLLGGIFIIAVVQKNTNDFP